MKKLYLLFVYCCLSFSTSFAAPSTLLLSGGSPTAASTICQGATQVVIYTYTVTTNATANGITNFSFTTTGTAISGTDITNFAVWTSSVSATFSAATAVQLGTTLTTGLGGGAGTVHTETVTFTAVPLKVSSANYIFITATIPATATPGNTIKVDGFAAAAATYTVAISATVPLTNSGGITPTGNTAASGVWTIVGTPTAISGPAMVCTTNAITLSDAITSGTWSSSTISVASVGSTTGLVTGGAAGTSTITYSTGCGSAVTTTITVQGIPGAISGPSTVCSGGSIINLSDALTGGSWSSSTTTVAIVGSATGVVTSGMVGTTTISYSNGCGAAAARTVIVTTTPTTINGPATVCTTNAITLSDAIAGGAWSSGTISVASVGTATGLVTGGVSGTSTITYSTGCGAAATATVTVLGVPGAISGTTTVCYGGGTTTLSDATSGGTWSSGTIVVAAINPTTGLVTGGIATGTTTITYSTGCGAAATTTVTSQSPLTPPASITGPVAVCQGTIIVLSDATSGGVWSSGNTLVASVNPSGVVRGVSGGTTTISYTIGNSCGSLSAISSITVSSLPAPAAIAGNTSVCGMSVLSDAVSGGIWSSSNTSIATIDATGTVYGVSISTATISYIMTNGCGTVYTTTLVTINPLPSLSAITGPSTVCAGNTITLNDAPPGGVWSSSNNMVATVVAGTGVVTGVAAGSAIISYMITNSCGSGLKTASVNTALLAPVPHAIAGIMSLCVGSTLILSDATSGGVWSCTPLSIATISGLGIVSGVSGGSAAISYSVTNSCGTVSAAASVTIVPLPVAGPITGSDSVCPGHTTTLADITSGGVWSSSVPFYATISGTGVVTGINQGLDNISYTVTNSCGSATAQVELVVLPALSNDCNPSNVGMVNGTAIELKVFPNPNPGIFTMELLSAADEPVHVIITNVVGEKIKEFIAATNRDTNIQIAPVAGIYFLSANTASSTNVVRLVVTN